MRLPNSDTPPRANECPVETSARRSASASCHVRVLTMTRQASAGEHRGVHPPTFGSARLSRHQHAQSAPPTEGGQK